MSATEGCARLKRGLRTYDGCSVRYGRTTRTFEGGMRILKERFVPLVVNAVRV